MCQCFPEQPELSGPLKPGGLLRCCTQTRAGDRHELHSPFRASKLSFNPPAGQRSNILTSKAEQRDDRRRCCVFKLVFCPFSVGEVIHGSAWSAAPTVGHLWRVAPPPGGSRRARAQTGQQRTVKDDGRRIKDEMDRSCYFRFRF